MGINGLLPLLSPVSNSVHISEYAGKVVAIDGHCWLHKGAFSCAAELAMGIYTTKYVAYFMHFINMLHFYKVIPLVVFDGESLPMKEVTNSSRTQKRQESLSTGFDLHKSGDYTEAISYFQKAITITKAMIYEVVKKLNEIEVQHIVAPYEADSQLAYLAKNGYVSAVVTEDSDLLAFGCPEVIFKMDRFGQGTRIFFDDIPKAIKLIDFNLNSFRQMCMLSGCDYLPSLKGIGIKTSLNLFKKHGNIEKVLNRLRLQKNIKKYEQEFKRAEAAFLYQFVADIRSSKFVRMNELPQDFKQEFIPLLGDQPKDVATPFQEKLPIFKNLHKMAYKKHKIAPWFRLSDISQKKLHGEQNAEPVSESLSRRKDPYADSDKEPKMTLLERFRALKKQCKKDSPVPSISNLQVPPQPIVDLSHLKNTLPSEPISEIPSTPCSSSSKPGVLESSSKKISMLPVQSEKSNVLTEPSNKLKRKVHFSDQPSSSIRPSQKQKTSHREAEHSQEKLPLLEGEGITYKTSMLILGNIKIPIQIAIDPPNIPSASKKPSTVVKTSEVLSTSNLSSSKPSASNPSSSKPSASNQSSSKPSASNQSSSKPSASNSSSSKPSMLTVPSEKISTLPEPSIKLKRKAYFSDQSDPSVRPSQKQKTFTK